MGDEQGQNYDPLSAAAEVRRRKKKTRPKRSETPQLPPDPKYDEAWQRMRTLPQAGILLLYVGALGTLWGLAKSGPVGVSVICGAVLLGVTGASLLRMARRKACPKCGSDMTENAPQAFRLRPEDPVTCKCTRCGLPYGAPRNPDAGE